MEYFEEAVLTKDPRDQIVFKKALFSFRDERRYVGGTTFEAHERHY